MLAKFASLPFDEWQGCAAGLAPSRAPKPRVRIKGMVTRRSMPGLGLRSWVHERAAGAARLPPRGAAARPDSVAARRVRHQGGAQATHAWIHDRRPSGARSWSSTGNSAHEWVLPIRRRAAALPAQADPASGDAGLGGADGAALRRRLLPQRERAQLLGAARSRRRAQLALLRVGAGRRRLSPFVSSGAARPSASTATAAATTPPPTTRRPPASASTSASSPRRSSRRRARSCGNARSTRSTPGARSAATTRSPTEERAGRRRGCASASSAARGASSSECS